MYLVLFGISLYKILILLCMYFLTFDASIFLINKKSGVFLKKDVHDLLINSCRRNEAADEDGVSKQSFKAYLCLIRSA